MSVERDVTEETVRIRTPRMGWMPLILIGLVVFAIRALEWVVPAGPWGTDP